MCIRDRPPGARWSFRLRKFGSDLVPWKWFEAHLHFGAECVSRVQSVRNVFAICSEFRRSFTRLRVPGKGYPG
eukprot:326023-Rhodomonas_salina.1